MAGEQLFKLLKSRGGSATDYSDVVYGTVIQPKPLKVQISNSMVLTDDFIELGKHIGKFKVRGKLTSKLKFKGETDPKAEAKFTDKDSKDLYLEVDNELKKDDKVTLIRCDGGQRFYLFERVDKDGFGF